MVNIDKMKIGPWNKTLAYFDLKTSEGLIIKGFRLVEGNNEMFVGCPSEKGKDNNYYDRVWLTKELKDEVRELAKAAYDEGGGEAPAANKQAETSDEPDDEYDDIPF